MSMFSVPIIAFILPPTKAMMLLCFPVIVTNLIQMNIKKGISNYRFLPMFIMLFVGILIGGKLILNLPFKTISIICNYWFFLWYTWWIVYILCTTNYYFFSFIKFGKRKFYKNHIYNVFFSLNTIVLFTYLSWVGKFLWFVNQFSSNCSSFDGTIFWN